MTRNWTGRAATIVVAGGLLAGCAAGTTGSGPGGVAQTSGELIVDKSP